MLHLSNYLHLAVIGLKNNFNLLFDWPLRTGFTVSDSYLLRYFKCTCSENVDETVRIRSFDLAFAWRLWSVFVGGSRGG